MPSRAGLRSLSLGISTLSAYILKKTIPFLPPSVCKRHCQPLNIVKTFSGLRLQPVNISLSIRENVLTSRLLTGVNKMPTPLTLRGCTKKHST